MSLEERVTDLEKSTKELEEDTIIPEFQNPDTCVFCDDKSYDSVIFQFLRIFYNYKNETEYQRQNKETCMHHKDEWLKHSHRTGGFMWSAITHHGKKSMTGKEIIEVFKNKEERERLLTEKYNESKKFTCAAHLYLTDVSKIEKNRYTNSFTIEDDIPVQNKIIQNKIKTYYTNTLEFLQAYDEENK